MPSKAEHLDKAEHNEHFASRLNQDGNYVNYRDWVVTGYFYSAVHYVEAYLATKSPPVHSENHPARDTTIGSDGVLQQIYDEYRALKDDSTNARYMMVMPTPITVANYVQPNHEKIKSYLPAHIP